MLLPTVISKTRPLPIKPLSELCTIKRKVNAKRLSLLFVIILKGKAFVFKAKDWKHYGRVFVEHETGK